MIRKTKIFNGLAALFALAVLAAPAASLAAEPVKLTLEKSLTIAMERNTGILIARSQRDKAFYQKREAFGLALPNLDVSASYTREMENPEVEFFGESFKLRPDESTTLNANLEQNVYSRAVSAGYKATTHMLNQAEARVNVSRNDVAAMVKEMFYSALFARDLIKVNEESVNQLKELLKDSKDREAVGLNTEYDTLRFETRLAEAIPELIAAKNAYRKSSLDLLDVLGLDPLADAEIDGELEYEPFSIGLDQALEMAVNNRPELAAAGEGVSAASQLVNAQRSELYPSVKAFANFNTSDSPGLGDSKEWTDSWNVGLRVEMNIFDGRERSSRIKQRIADLDIAQRQKDRAARMVLIEVKTSIDELEKARQFIESQKKSVDYAKETYRIATISHREGVATQLELLDAQLTLTKSKINFSRSLYAHSVAKTRLLRAIGEEKNE